MLWTRSVLLAVMATAGTAGMAAGSRSRPTANLHVSVAVAKRAMNSLGKFSFRQVRGGGAFVASNSFIDTDAEIWGRSEATKIQIVTLYGADANRPGRLTLQVGSEAYVCFIFATKAVYHWCKASIEAAVATNSSRSERVVVVMDEGAARVPYRFTISSQKSPLEPVALTITPG